MDSSHLEWIHRFQQKRHRCESNNSSHPLAGLAMARFRPRRPPGLSRRRLPGELRGLALGVLVAGGATGASNMWGVHGRKGGISEEYSSYNNDDNDHNDDNDNNDNNGNNDNNDNNDGNDDNDNNDNNNHGNI